MRLLAPLLLLALSPSPGWAAEPPHPIRLAGQAFDRAAQIEVRDLSAAAAEGAIRDAFAELDRARLEARALEKAVAAGGPVRLDASTSGLLRRAEAFCFWSEGAVGPLGGAVFELWGLRRPVSALPTPNELEAAVASAGCDRMALDLDAGTVSVAAGSRMDLFPFEIGWGVDRVAELLRARGSSNFWIAVGPVLRGAGPGPAGRGWPVTLQPLPGQETPATTFYLRDRSAAILTPRDHPLEVAGETIAPYLDLRSGRPTQNIAALMVVTEMGIDADGVAYAMYALGAGDGMLLVGSLQPRPAIRWYLGSGGAPVITDVNWASVPKR